MNDIAILLESVKEDFLYLKNIENASEKLRDRISNSVWQMIDTIYYDDRIGICEHCGTKLKKGFILRKKGGSQTVTLGISCYKAIIFQDKKSLNPETSFRKYQQSKQEIEKKKYELISKLQVFIENELPYLSEKAREYGFEFDEDELIQQLKDWKLLELGFQRIIVLQSNIERLELERALEKEKAKELKRREEELNRRRKIERINAEEKIRYQIKIDEEEERKRKRENKISELIYRSESILPDINGKSEFRKMGWLIFVCRKKNSDPDDVIELEELLFKAEEYLKKQGDN